MEGIQEGRLNINNKVYTELIYPFFIEPTKYVAKYKNRKEYLYNIKLGRTTYDRSRYSDWESLNNTGILIRKTIIYKSDVLDINISRERAE